MPEYDTLALRRGLILRAMTKGPEQRRHEPTTRTVGEARELGLRIYNSFDDYSQRIKDAIEREAFEANLPATNFLARDKEWMRSRFAPGLILDFPDFSFSMGGLSVTGRSCVTVCFAHTASKIWTRLVLRAAPGELIATRGKQTPSSVHVASLMCDRINQYVRALYLRDFKRSLGVSKGLSVRFEKVGELNYIGVEEDPKTIADAVDILDGDRVAPSSANVKALAGRLGALVSSISERTSGGERKAHSAESLEDIRCFNTRNGNPAVFRTWVDAGSATFAVASARANALPRREQKKLGRVRNSSALDVMSELASLMAAEF